MTNYEALADQIFAAIAAYTKAEVRRGVEASHSDLLALMAELEARIAAAEVQARKG